jgi:hypothetical protein
VEETSAESFDYIYLVLLHLMYAGLATPFLLHTVLSLTNFLKHAVLKPGCKLCRSFLAVSKQCCAANDSFEGTLVELVILWKAFVLNAGEIIRFQCFWASAEVTEITAHANH